MVRVLSSVALLATRAQAMSECNLSVPTLFHDIGVRTPSGATKNPFGAYSIVRTPSGDFALTSLNATWSGALTATYNASAEVPLTVTFPASMGGKEPGSTGGAPNCDVFEWGVGGREGVVAVWELGPLPPPGSPCHFEKEVWHSVAEGPGEVGLVFELNSLNTTHFSIHSLNETFDDTVATIVLPLHGQNRAVSASFSDMTPKGAVKHGVVQGTECTTIVWTPAGPGHFWELGPLPPPRPPPPAQCDSSYNKTACVAVKPKDSCEWCTSSDGAHALCFHADHLPTGKEWACSKK